MTKVKVSDFDSYQNQCKKTAVYPDIGNNFVYPTLGLVGEAGEVAEKIKKIIRDEGGKLNKDNKKELEKELGDILWYVAQISTELGLKFSSVVKTNQEKLISRKSRGVLRGSGDNR